MRRFGPSSRLVMIGRVNARPLDERVRMLRELTEHVHTIYLARRWRVIKIVPQEITQLRAKLDVLEGNASPTAARN